jgi:hypothetical protein
MSRLPMTGKDADVCHRRLVPSPRGAGPRDLARYAARTSTGLPYVTREGRLPAQSDRRGVLSNQDVNEWNMLHGGAGKVRLR